MSLLMQNIVLLWVAAISLSFGAFVAQGLSAHDDSWGDRLGCAIPVLVLVAAAIYSILMGLNVAPLWYR